MKCNIILLPPITLFEGKTIAGVHESPFNPTKLLEYRNDIISRLEEAAKGEKIMLLNWNHYIENMSIPKMLVDQFHFTDYGKKKISNIIYNIIKSKEITYKGEEQKIKIPFNNALLPRYYTMFPGRGNCEILFRLLMKYLYQNEFLNKEKNIIDLGAWIGDNTIPWAMRITGSVYAIDPSSQNINYINQLCELNNLFNVETIQTCISDKIQDVYANGDINHTEFNCKKGSIKLKSNTLDNLYNEKKLKNIEFIHLDVEGFEQKVLDGSVNILENDQPIVVWENHLKTDDFKGTCDFFSKKKYSSYLINELFPHCRSDCRNFISIPKNHLIIENIGKINKIFKTEENLKFQADKSKAFLICLDAK